jgi:SSS family transporter
MPLAAALVWVDVAVVMVYLMLLVGIGAYFSRRQKSMEQYFLAGRSMGWIPVGMSLMAALNSGIDYLAGPFGVFKYGLIFIMGATSWIFLYPWVAYVTMPFYRRLNITSAYEYLEQRFNAAARTMAACIFLAWRLGWMATALYVPSLAITTITGWPLWLVIILLGGLVTLYTMLGGIEGIIWTDVIQFCVMLAGVGATLWVTIASVDGGIAGIWSYAAEKDHTNIIQPIPDGTPAQKLMFLLTDYRSIIGILLATVIGRATTYTCEQSTVQRFQATRSLKDSRQAFIVNAIGDTFWTLGLAFVGMALFAYFKGVLPSGVKEDSLTIYFMREKFPSGLNGLVVAAVLASGLSSIDAAINACTSIIMVDFYKRYFAKNRQRVQYPAAGDSKVLSYETPQHLAKPVAPTEQEQRHDVKLSRIITVMFAIVGMILAAQVQHIGNIIEIAQKIIQSFTGPLLGVYLLGMFTRRANGQGVVVGGTLGTATSLYVAFGTDIGFIWPTVFGLVTTLVVSYVVSLVAGPVSMQQQQLTWRNIMRRPLPTEQAAEPAPAAAKV